jgi:hypothetical protein
MKTLTEEEKQVLVARSYNSSYSGDRDQEDCSSKPAPGKWFVRPYLNKTGLAEWFKW